jgi:hypothetical protein
MGLISFEGAPPFDLELTREPSARGADGNVELTLTVGVDAQDELPLSLVMSLDHARSLYAQMTAAIRMAEVQAKSRS